MGLKLTIPDLPPNLTSPTLHLLESSLLGGVKSSL